MSLLTVIGQALLTAVGMAWQVLWSLVLGFLVSGMIQAYVSRAGMSKVLGRAGMREIAMAAGFGAASSSCSYAAIAAAKSMFKRGAHLIPALAFMFASTNLVLELGLVLWQLMGWQFALAEWLGGVILIALMALLVKVTYPSKLVEEGRTQEETEKVQEHDHDDIRGVPAPLQVVENAVVGPLIAVISFVCSIGNVPLAAILFAGGITFGGAIAFLYADLIVLPIIDIYRKYYGWRLAAYITGVLFTTMVVTAILIDALFSGLDRLFPAVHFIPTANPHFLQQVTMFSFDYTFVLNILALLVVGVLVYLNIRHPMRMHSHGEHAEHGASFPHRREAHIPSLPVTWQVITRRE
ncbi:hypothetical protein KSC_070710 [Ktedonobacter sp. SOSP1-52]|uniref:permease n=1 Tax=Ktedonobacter sp. SOSP1-52 TaxID=2778366 RepID=UPI00191580AC|nr:permease [Ktedonobacter sp. SOSP1-52]GHO68179.1 hypothetical protein KSC_070710 [Ktedonobacter sp. SOSP1-52]